MNLYTLLEMVADAVPDRQALGPRAAPVTYRQLLMAVQNLAADMSASGSAVAGVLDETSAATPAWLFAAAAAGHPFVPLNYRLPDEQLHAQLGELGQVRCLVGPDQEHRVKGLDNLTAVSRHDVEARLRDMRGVTDTLVPAETASEAVLLFTSGTTGSPKIVVLRHDHLTAYVLSTVEFLSAREDEAILVSVPPYHVAGVSTILTSVFSGRRMVQLPSFDPQTWVRVVRDEGVTQAMVVPTMLARILDVLERDGEALPDLRHLAYGGGRMPMPVIERAMALLPHVDWVNAYGLTETSSTIAILGPEDHREAVASRHPAVRARLRSVGRPVPTVEVEVRDAEGRSLPVGQAGEVHVRGPQVSGQYRTHSALAEDGWFATRDHGWLDEDGYLYLEGRADDVIVRGAENLSPGEIEDVLLGHPAVADAAVVGVPDLEWGERVEAVVVLAADVPGEEEELQAWVRERLRSSKTPARIHVRDALPRNDLGKLQRSHVRKDLAKSAE